MTKVAMILSGCGYKDGAEIRESVLSLLYLDELGAEVSVFAPDKPQAQVVNHASGEVSAESRNILVESARIARGNVKPLGELRPEAFDALVIPGGFGVALNLSDFAQKGSGAQVDKDFQSVVQSFLKVGKPIGAICIAPAVLAAAAAGGGITLTIGEDNSVAAAIEALGNTHKPSPTHQAVIDEKHRVASCSAYMRDDARISDVAKGIHQVVEWVMKMAQTNRKAA